jgi:hypothetical protein
MRKVREAHPGLAQARPMLAALLWGDHSEVHAEDVRCQDRSKGGARAHSGTPARRNPSW